MKKYLNSTKGCAFNKRERLNWEKIYYYLFLIGWITLYILETVYAQVDKPRAGVRHRKTTIIQKISQKEIVAQESEVKELINSMPNKAIEIWDR